MTKVKWTDKEKGVQAPKKRKTEIASSLVEHFTFINVKNPSKKVQGGSLHEVVTKAKTNGTI